MCTSSNDNHCEIRVPNLDLGDSSIKLGSWLSPLGSKVRQGERIVEVVGDDVLVELIASTDGILAERAVAEGQELSIGQVLGVIRATEPPS